MKLRVDYCTRWLLALVAVFGMQWAMAQRTITGSVTDAENGEPLIGATVLVVGTSTGSVTDIDGSYSIDVSDDDTQLEFSYTGYTAKTVDIGSSNRIDVVLSPGETLEEVVVVGYSSVRKRDLTGSVTSLGEKDFNKGLVVAPDQLIQGKAPGVQILNNSGQPGAQTTVRIRGNTSIRAGNDPLFVVDGVQLTGNSSKPGTNAGDLGATPPSNPLNFLNPNDIENIQVLKDASATAIYGSRGANGVVIITTKRGRTGEPRISLNTSVGFSGVLREYPVLSADEYRNALNQYGITGGDFGNSVDAFDEITRTGVVNNHSFAISGGGENSQYRISVGFFDQEGILKGNALQRVSTNINGNFTLLNNDRLKIDYNLIAARTDEDAPSVTTDAGFRGSLIGNALQWNPTAALYNDDGSPVIDPPFGDFVNPVALIDAFSDEVETTDLIASIAPSYEILDGLTYKVQYSVFAGIGSRRTSLAGFINVQDVEGRGLASFGEEQNTNQILTHTLTYNRDIGAGINLTALAGYEYQKRDEEGVNLSARDFSVDNFDYTTILQNSSTSSRQISSFRNPTSELQSYFGQVNLNLADKYLFTGTLRADGSSKFGDNNEYGIFPALAFAWNVHNEEFFSSSVFNNLKLRLGYGQTGNSEFPAGAAQDRFAFGQESVNLTNVANPDLQWEETTTYNAGLDFSLFDYRVTGSIELFRRETENLLFQLPTIQPAADALYWINLDGQVINQGVEVAVNATVVETPKLSWSLGGNITFLENNLEGYDGPPIVYGTVFGQGATGANIHRLVSDQPLNAFYLRDFTGIGDDGTSQFANDGQPSYLGDPNPNAIVGISSTLTYGRFSASINMNGTIGNDIYNNTRNTVLPIGNLGNRNIDANILDQENMEALSNSIQTSDRYLEDGSYLKIANASLSYQFGNIGDVVSNIRAFVAGTNLAVFTDYEGFDPEVNTVNDANGLPSAGIEYIPYPSARTITFGLNVDF